MVISLELSFSFCSNKKTCFLLSLHIFALLDDNEIWAFPLTNTQYYNIFRFYVFVLVIIRFPVHESIVNWDLKIRDYFRKVNKTVAVVNNALSLVRVRATLHEVSIFSGYLFVQHMFFRIYRISPNDSIFWIFCTKFRMV